MTENLRYVATDRLLEKGHRNRTSKCTTFAKFIAVLLIIFAVLAIGFLTFLLHFNHSTNNQNCKKRVIGYFEDTGTSELRNSHFEKLTHVVFSHNFLTKNGTVEFKYDEAKSRFENLKLMANGLKVMISIDGDENFSAVMAKESKRRNLVNSIVSFLEENQIDGVDLFWKWPRASDKSSYSLFVKELRQKLLKKSNDYILSVTSAPAGIPGYWPDGFDLEEMIHHVDFMNIFSMDFYGPWGWLTGPAAPLYHGIAPRENFTVDYSAQYYSCKLKETSKLNIVIPMDVRIWENVKTSLSGSDVYRKSEMVNGKIQATILKSRKLAEETGIKLGQASWNEKTQSSYIFDENAGTITTFEDKMSIEAKLNFVNEKNLGGVWIRNVDMDDDKDSLLSNVNFNGFCSTKSFNDVNYQCPL